MSIVTFIVIATAVCVYFDAKSVGIGRAILGEKRGFLDMPPIGWALACLLLWIIAFPLYLIYRNQYVSRGERRRNNHIFSVEALEKLAQLRERGVITEEEFQRQKKDILDS